MRKIILITFIFLLSFMNANTLSINEKTSYIDILSNSQYYIDTTKKLEILEIIQKKNQFQNNNKTLLGFGYSPDFVVWLKIKLHNESNKKIKKILEYQNPLTTNVYFYDAENPNKVLKGGLFYQNKNKNVLNPIYTIELDAKETKTYYVKVSSYITTLIIKLKLWDDNSFFNNELKHQIILALFFGSMAILGIYNLFLFFFTKDQSYLYYVLYIFGIIFHQLAYVGLIKVFFPNPETIKLIINSAALIVAIPVFALGMFTRNFLQTQKYPKHNKILNIFLVLIPISVLFFLITNGYDKFRNLLTMLLLIYLMYLTLYATIKRNPQAYFILFGWTIFLTSGMLMFLSSAGVFNIYEYIPYLIEISFVLEALAFSIALANKINSLQKEKEEANQKLIQQEKNETKRLSKLVSEKTQDLRKTLKEKSLLLKELNHRVKNNMQTIVSLIRLQNDEIKDKKLQDVLTTIQNRINAMSHLHELLYRKDDISHIDAYEYFEILIEEVKFSYEKDIHISLNVETQLKIEEATYCGLILNELTTNSFKYAFPQGQGSIYINLSKKDNYYILKVKDNGIGYDENSLSTDSLGLTLVRTLAVEQLNGVIKIDSKEGVDVLITWKDNDKGKDTNS